MALLIAILLLSVLVQPALSHCCQGARNMNNYHAGYSLPALPSPLVPLSSRCLCLLVFCNHSVLHWSWDSAHPHSTERGALVPRTVLCSLVHPRPEGARGIPSFHPSSLPEACWLTYPRLSLSVGATPPLQAGPQACTVYSHLPSSVSFALPPSLVSCHCSNRDLMGVFITLKTPAVLANEGIYTNVG